MVTRRLVAGMALLSVSSVAFVSASSANAQSLPLTGDVFWSSDSINGQKFLEMRPQSNAENSSDIGRNAHTHLRILLSPSGSVSNPVSGSDSLKNLENYYKGASPDGGRNNNSGNSIILNTPSSIACVYNLVPQPPTQPAGCNPAYTTVNPTGGGGAIAIVDAYDDPSAARDLAYFSNYFGLAPANFQVVYVGGPAPYITGTRPRANSGWQLEEALDTEWAHAMAPGAKIYLVEAQNASYSALFTAILAAEYLVSQNGGGEISMSWGGSEFASESAYDAYFAPPGTPSNVAFFASAGDTGGIVSYPASSPYVTGVGGTTINRNTSGAFVSETTWSGGGGGLSCCEAMPVFQSATAIQNVVGQYRGTPDVAFDANPNSGSAVAVYEAGLWYIVGGTSVGAPSTAGIVNVADHAAGTFPSASAELAKFYGDDGSTLVGFRDITAGTCGMLSAKVNYDLCTGLGSSIAYAGK